MTTNYKHINKDMIKCGDYITSNTGTLGLGDVSYNQTNNAPITIASPYYSANDFLVTTCIYDQTSSGFKSISTFKDNDGNLGGPFNNGTIYYLSVDNEAIQNYKYNGKPIIQAGTFTTSSNGTITETFSNAFENAPIVVVCPNGTGYAIITCRIYQTTTTSFDVISYYKDGSNGENGGGVYSGGSFNYIAVDSTAIDKYKLNDNPIIKCGTFTTNTNGTITTATTPSLGFPTGANVRVFCSPRGNNINLVTCNIVSVSPSTFTVLAVYKDGRNGENGGGTWDGNFNYIAVQI